MSSSHSSDSRKRKKVSFALPSDADSSKTEFKGGDEQVPLLKRPRKINDDNDVDSDDDTAKAIRGKRSVVESSGAEAGEEEYSATQLDTLQRSSKEEQVPIIPFNLKSDREAGYFDANGSYVWQRRDAGEEKEESDAWLDSVDAAKDGMIHKGSGSGSGSGSTSGLAPTNRVDAASKRPSEVESLYKIYRLLGERKETVLEGVQRYGRREKAKAKARSEEKENIRKLESLSACASDLIGDIPTIYEESKAEIRERIKPQLEARMGEVKWVYKITKDDHKLHGPYTSVQMQQWRDAGYFVGSNAAYLRRHHSTPASSQSHSPNPNQGKADLAADLMDDSESEDEQPVPQNDWLPSNQVDFEDVTF